MEKISTIVLTGSIFVGLFLVFLYSNFDQQQVVVVYYAQRSDRHLNNQRKFLALLLLSYNQNT